MNCWLFATRIYKHNLSALRIHFTFPETKTVKPKKMPHISARALERQIQRLKRGKVAVTNGAAEDFHSAQPLFIGIDIL